MIKTKKDLNEYLREDNKYHWQKEQSKLMLMLRKEPYYYIQKYLYLLRKEEYYINNISTCKLFIFLSSFYSRRKNHLGNKIGLLIPPNCVDKGITIYHPNIIINEGAKIGQYTILHGNNCIGNNGKTADAPILANNVDVGYSATIIGSVKLADNIIVGANSVVVKSFLSPNDIIAGVPAKSIKRK